MINDRTARMTAPRGWLDAMEEELQAIMVSTAPALPAHSVTLLFDPADPPEFARLYGPCGAADLVRVLRATADRVETGALRPAIDGRMRWVETDPALPLPEQGDCDG